MIETLSPIAHVLVDDGIDDGAVIADADVGNPLRRILFQFLNGLVTGRRP